MLPVSMRWRIHAWDSEAAASPQRHGTLQLQALHIQRLGSEAENSPFFFFPTSIDQSSPWSVRKVTCLYIIYILLYCSGFVSWWTEYLLHITKIFLCWEDEARPARSGPIAHGSRLLLNHAYENIWTYVELFAVIICDTRIEDSFHPSRLFARFSMLETVWNKGTPARPDNFRSPILFPYRPTPSTDWHHSLHQRSHLRWGHREEKKSEKKKKSTPHRPRPSGWEKKKKGRCILRIVSQLGLLTP